jgi:quercetin dioxygenase-like cupin family protein
VTAPRTGARAAGLEVGKTGAMRHVRLIGSVAVLAWPLHAAEADDAAPPTPPVVVTPLLTTSVTASGQPIVLPRKDAQLVASIYDIAPGAVLPEHEHPYPRYAYVLAGTLRVTNTDTGRSDTYGPGAFVPEAVGQWHRGASVGGEPVRLLVIDLVEKGRGNVVVRK